MKNIVIIRLVSVFAVSLLFTVAVVAQEYEYGKPAELKGLTHIFIDTGPDVGNFNRIKNKIVEANLPGIKIVDSMDDAEVTLTFRGDHEQVVEGSRGDIETRNIRTGKALVTIPSKSGKRLRVLMNFEDKQGMFKTKYPSEKFAKQFVEAYKEANSIKN